MTAEDCWLAELAIENFSVSPRGQNSNSQFILKPADDSYEAWHISQYFEVSCFQRNRTAFGRRRDSNQHMG